MSLIIPANSAAAGGGFDVANSCMFNSADSASFSKTPSSNGSNTVWTVSMWVKRGSLAAGKIHAAGTSGTYEFLFDDTNFGLTLYNGAATVFVTSRALRDVSAWYHIVLAYNTGASGTDKCKLFINGVQETAFATDNRSSAGTMNNINQNVVQYVGRTHGGGLFDGYMAEVCIIDGTQYAASDFGEFDEDSGIWKPIDVSGLTFGTNGFYLDFKDSANLGNDANGGTDLTENNIAATDQATDTPTNNFVTFNPLDSFYFGGSYSNGNTTLTTDVAKAGYTTGTFGASEGKWYWEMKLIQPVTSGNYHITGVASAYQGSGDGLGYVTGGYAYQGYDGKIRANGSVSDYGDTWTTNNIIGTAIDLDNNKLYFSKNGVWQNSGNPESGATGTGAFALTASASTSLGAYLPATGDHAGAGYSAAIYSYNFGSPYYAIVSSNADGNSYGNFEYEVPSGYFALCTKNLAEYG